MSSALKIKILKGHPNGDLDLSDRGHTKAKQRDLIEWSIKNKSGVASIEAIEVEKGNDIFIVGPHPRSNGSWQAEIDPDVDVDDWCKYLIRWKDDEGTIKECDPLITIRPSSVAKIVAVTIVSATAVALLTYNLLFDKRKKRKIF